MECTFADETSDIGYNVPSDSLDRMAVASGYTEACMDQRC